MSAAEGTGVVLWAMERTHPDYGEEEARLVINLAGQLLLVVGDRNDTAATTLTRDEADGLRSALAGYLTGRGDPR